jgi:hypothetical protein
MRITFDSSVTALFLKCEFSDEGYLSKQNSLQDTSVLVTKVVSFTSLGHEVLFGLSC